MYTAPVFNKKMVQDICDKTQNYCRALCIGHLQYLRPCPKYCPLDKKKFDNAYF